MTPPTPLPKLATLPTYKPGKSAEATMREYGLTHAAKLSSNENPYGPLPQVVDAIARAAHDINRYPDSNATAVRDAIAAHIGVDVARVTVGAASSGILLQAINAFAGPGDEVLFGWRSFEAYPIYTRQMGATDVQVPLRGYDIDVDAIAAAVTDRTKMVLLANPNNPTGTAVDEASLRRFLDAVPERVLVVLDEAYREFIRPGGAPDGVKVFGMRDNVLVSRTLSKAYGLAGLRIGYGVAHPDVVAAVDKVAAPFSISNVTQAATLAALQCGEEMAARVAVINSERDRVVDGVRALGLVVPQSHANLVWLPAGAASTAVFDGLERVGVVARVFAGEGVRVSIGMPEENDLFLVTLAALVAPLQLQDHWVRY